MENNAADQIMNLIQFQLLSVAMRSIADDEDDCKDMLHLFELLVRHGCPTEAIMLAILDLAKEGEAKTDDET